MAADDNALAEIAGSILDGTPVDWAAAESGMPAGSALLGPLRMLAAVAAVHRRAPEAADRWGPLHVLERVGAGAYGDVYRAWDPRLDRQVALKLLRGTAPAFDHRTESFIQEGRLLARVRHPNVVTIYGADQLDDRVGLWMEFVPGRTLAQMMAAGHRFTEAGILEIGVQLCEAVAAVHAAGLLHRDVKAHNVMRSDAGRVVLMDFGTGHLVETASAGGAAGTPLYLAPEVLAGGPPSVAGDVYSIGVLLFLLLTGEYPVTGRDLDELRRAHRTSDPDLRPLDGRGSRGLRRVIARAIEPDPTRRYAAAADLGGALARLSPRQAALSLRHVAAIAALAAIVVWFGGQLRSRTPAATEILAEGSAAAAPAAASVLVRPSIAVLPLSDLSGEASSELFVDGLTDELIRNLAAVDGLDVRSQTSSFAFKHAPRNVTEIGRQLGVGLLVEGSVQRAGGRLRINVRLIQVDGDLLLWAERFERPLEDVFAIQDEISRAIVGKLRLTLGRAQRRDAIDVETYERFLRARAFINRGALAATQAVPLLEEVIAREPDYAPAHAALGNAYAQMSMSPYPGPGSASVSFAAARAIMEPAATRALALDPLLADAHAVMGWVHARGFAWADAEAAFRRAIALNPSLSWVYTDFVYSTLRPQRKLDEAARLLEAALAIDPISGVVRSELAVVLVETGRYDEALEHLSLVRRRDPAHSPLQVERDTARALYLSGRAAEAVALLEPRETGLQQWLAHAYVRAGRRGDAERLARAHRGFPFREAIIYAALGDRDRVADAVEQMLRDEPQRVAQTLAIAELAWLHDDPRIRRVRQQLRLP